MLRRIGKNLNPLNIVDTVIDGVGLGSNEKKLLKRRPRSDHRRCSKSSNSDSDEDDGERKTKSRRANASFLQGSQIDESDSRLGDGAAARATGRDPNCPPLNDGTFWPSVIFIALAILISHLMGRMKCTILYSLPFIYISYRLMIKRITRIERQTIAEFERNLKISSVENHLEEAEWLNFIITRFWNVLEPTLTAKMGEKIATKLKDKKPPFLESINLSEFTLGSTPPLIEGVQTFQRTKVSTIHMDLSISFIPRNAKQPKSVLDGGAVWNNKILIMAKVNPLLSIPILIEDITFKGRLRVQINLAPTAPFVDTVTLCLLEQPLLDFSLRALTTFEGGMDISDWLEHLVQESLSKSMVAPNSTTISMQPKQADHFKKAHSLLKVSFKALRGLVLPDIRHNLIVLIRKNGLNVTYIECDNGKFSPTNEAIILLNGEDDTVSFMLVDAPFIIDNTILSMNGTSKVVDHVSSDLVGIQTFHPLQQLDGAAASSSNVQKDKWAHLRGRHSKNLELQSTTSIIRITEEPNGGGASTTTTTSGLLTVHLSQLKGVQDMQHLKKGGEVSCVYEVYLHGNGNGKTKDILSNDPLNQRFYRSAPVLKERHPTWHEDWEVLVKDVEEEFVTVLVKTLPKYGSRVLHKWTSKVSCILDHSSWWEFDDCGVVGRNGSSNGSSNNPQSTKRKEHVSVDGPPKFHSSFKFTPVNLAITDDTTAAGNNASSLQSTPTPVVESGNSGVMWCQIKVKAVAPVTAQSTNPKGTNEVMFIETSVGTLPATRKMVKAGEVLEMYTLVKGFDWCLEIKMSTSTNEAIGDIKIDPRTNEVVSGSLEKEIGWKIVYSAMEDLSSLKEVGIFGNASGNASSSASSSATGGCLRFTSITLGNNSLNGVIKLYLDDLLVKEVPVDSTSSTTSTTSSTTSTVTVVDCGKVERTCYGDELVLLEFIDQDSNVSEGQATMRNLFGSNGKLTLSNGVMVCLDGLEMLTLPFQITRPTPTSGKLEIVLLGCKSLMAVDLTGTSDPYIVLKKDGERFYKTNVIKRQLNPEFNERTSCLVGEDALLELEVRDWNALQSSTRLGLLELDLSNICKVNHGTDTGDGDADADGDWSVWNDVPLSKTKSGTISFKLRFKPINLAGSGAGGQAVSTSSLSTAITGSAIDGATNDSSDDDGDSNVNGGDNTTNTNTNTTTETTPTKTRKKSLIKNFLSKI